MVPLARVSVASVNPAAVGVDWAKSPVLKISKRASGRNRAFFMI
jgi:hypothetical protein